MGKYVLAVKGVGMNTKQAVAHARKLFPAGLYQPPGSFRFSVDALLLASFIHGEQNALVADFGAGCGVVGLAYLLMNADSRVIGFERQAELVEAARVNAQSLGCDGRYDCITADIMQAGAVENAFFERGVRKSTSVNKQVVLENMAADVVNAPLESVPGDYSGLGAGVKSKDGFDIVLANPPYRIEGSGRLPLSPLRQRALFGPVGILEKFCEAARAVLAPHGRLGVVFPAEQADRITRAIQRAGLELERLLYVHGREGKPATLLLLEARKEEENRIPQGVREDTPLTLYDIENRLTRQAVRFCPFLG